MGSNEWKNSYLGEIAEIIMGQSPTGETCNQVGNGLPLLNGPTEFGNYHPSPVQYTTDPKKTSIFGDLLFCVRGSTTGRMNWSDQGYAIGRGIAAFRHKNGGEYQPFLKALIDYYLPLLLTEATGSTFPNVSSQQLNNLSIRIPPLSTQRRIAEILSALDDKIELNRQTNATLEAIAQAIFKEWFVNFNFPGATGERIESELGMIPKGWRVGKLGEVCEFAYGKGLKAEERIKGIYPVVGSGGIVGFHNKCLVKGPGIVVGRKGTIGETTWIHQDFFPIDTTFYINDLTGSKSLFFHYFLLKMQDFKKIGSDSAVPGLNRNMAYDISVTIPPLNVIQNFNLLICFIFEDIFNFEQQSSTLSKIRDELLPKLISGEIEV